MAETRTRRVGQGTERDKDQNIERNCLEKALESGWKKPFPLPMQLLSLNPSRERTGRVTQRTVSDANCQEKHPVKRSIHKAQRGRRVTSTRVRAQPAGRAEPGARGGGRFFRIEVAPGRRFIAFRYHDVGKKGGVERIAGQRPDRTWATAGWLIGKDLAHVERGRLVPDTVAARKVLSTLGVTPRHVRGDRFQAKDRPNVPERTKRKATMRRAQQRNIRKAPMGKGPRD